MKIIFQFLILILYKLTLYAQQELHIHHINVNNGDATIVAIYDTILKKNTFKVLIDGGQSSADKYILPYIKKMFGSDQDATRFNYIILTHYHDDHYNGLLAIRNGLIKADILIDPGGYVASRIFKNAPSAGVKPPNMSIYLNWLAVIDTAVRHNYLLARSTIIKRYDLSPYTSIGKKILLGKVGENKLELQCVAGWGNTITSGDSIVPNPAINRPSANNYTLAFLLNCGEFRYFLGGDMGGSGGSYIDQETPLSNFFNEKYPVSISMDSTVNLSGHICGFKANHHGSENSNTASFMEKMHSSIIVTSGGDKSNWQLPRSVFLKRLSKVIPVSVSSTLPDSIFNQGVYFTNLQNFNSGDTTLNTANALFKNKPGLNYSYGNQIPGKRNSYLIKVSDCNAIKSRSLFEVGSVDISLQRPYKRLAYFNCHRK